MEITALEASDLLIGATMGFGVAACIWAAIETARRIDFISNLLTIIFVAGALMLLGVTPIYWHPIEAYSYLGVPVGALIVVVLLWLSFQLAVRDARRSVGRE